MISKYPTIEKRTKTFIKNGKSRIEIRFYVVDSGSFNNCNGFGFKTEESLLRSYNWWYNNAYLKNRTSKETKQSWTDHERYDYYNTCK